MKKIHPKFGSTRIVTKFLVRRITLPLGSKNSEQIETRLLCSARISQEYVEDFDGHGYWEGWVDRFWAD